VDLGPGILGGIDILVDSRLQLGGLRLVVIRTLLLFFTFFTFLTSVRMSLFLFGVLLQRRRVILIVIRRLSERALGDRQNSMRTSETSLLRSCSILEEGSRDGVRG